MFASFTGEVPVGTDQDRKEAIMKTAKYVNVIPRTVLVAVLVAGAGTAWAQSPCDTNARLARQANVQDANEGFWLALANANNLEDAGERSEAFAEAFEERNDALEEAEGIFAWRRHVCAATGESRYDPEIDPDDFLSPAEIVANPNPYWPMIPGTVFTYEGENDEGEIETIVVEITDETREILGVECIVVRDTVSIEGDVLEDTMDWYAQDTDNNVWYFGELSFEIEDNEIVSLEGSWESGKDGAKPGIIMFAEPVVGTTYRQEFLLDDAEDVGEVRALNRSVSVPYDDFDGCLMTLDYTPLEPGVVEQKFYAPGVGFIKEVKPDTGETVELIAIDMQ